MQTYLQQQLKQHFPTRHEFLIGLSGGVDSIVLLHLFTQIKNIKLRAVHIHHGLSPNADAWAAFCQTVCRQWQVPLVIKKVQVQGKQGLEANARQARYQAVGEIITPAEIFTTAHHLDDQAETFFLSLKRGSGVKGLSAMQAVGAWQHFALFRPLVETPKADLVAYATEQHLHWMEDESNMNTDFDRNFLRQKVLPLLNERWSHFNQMVSRASRHCQEQQQLLEELLRPEFEQYFDREKGTLNIAAFPQFSILKQRQLIRLWLAECGQPMPSRDQLTDILGQMIAAEEDKQPQIKLGEKQIRRYQQRLFIVDILPKIEPMEYSLPPVIEKLILADHRLEISRYEDELVCNFSHQSHRLQLPAALSHETLTLRFCPPSKVAVYGKTQREQMKKIYQQHKIPPWQRPKTPTIFWQEQFIGVIAIP